MSLHNLKAFRYFLFVIRLRPEPYHEHRPGCLDSCLALNHCFPSSMNSSLSIPGMCLNSYCHFSSCHKALQHMFSLLESSSPLYTPVQPSYKKLGSTPSIRLPDIVPTHSLYYIPLLNKLSPGELVSVFCFVF